MTRKRSTRSIEDDLDRNREKLASAFDSLLSRSTVDLLTREALGLLRSNADVYRQVAAGAVRRNPLAVAVAGIGLAWLVLGKGSRTDDDADDLVEEVRSTRRRAARVVDEAELVAEGRWSEGVDKLRRAASARLRKLEEEARQTYDGLRDDMTDSAADARDYMGERAAVLADLAEDLRERFAHGLDDLSNATRDRIIAAREEAYAARLRAEEALGKGGREAKRMVEDHPMVAGAVALALGAALGAVLSRRSAATDADDADLDDDDLDDTEDDDFPESLEEAQQRWRDRKASRGRRARA
jgi:ElaB/YqjD/DUF883 family membrane-anchored ribosome-binding protein